MLLNKNAFSHPTPYYSIPYMFVCFIFTGVGYLLFVSHARITAQDIKCRLYGPCAVKSVTLNGVPQPSLTEVS